ncbi:cell division protein FtsW [Sphingobium xanthum]|nr:cell division protein FtsW [Sphingobium sp. B10D3B]MCW2400626.1 cell division protein FtsW [Sphingobium sp. B10D7B]MCW2407605.1 cell division protein FtsW [Sphingobium xanthum]
MSERGDEGVVLVEGEAAKPVTAPPLDVALSPLRARPGKPMPRERTALAIWFWEIDRVLLGLIVVLIAIGLVAVAAASPVAAAKLSTHSASLSPLYFFYRQLMWIGLGLPLMIVISMLPRTQARRLAVGLAALFAVMLVLVPIIGTSVNGASRWLGSGAFRFQPSEFLKPFFVVAIAWLLSLRARDASLPVIPLTGLLTGIVALLLMRQPDFGQTVIFVACWGALLLVGGASIKLLSGFACGGLGLFVLTYLFYDNGRERIDSFLNPVVDPAAGPDQVQLAYATITRGGLTGVGPGGGTAKFNLPEAHTDYIFSVIGEEFGLIACIAIALVYLAIIVRVLLRLLDEDDPFIVMATSGLVFVMGVQAVINMGVNIHIFPSKGMTLPFISYGGSSMIALCSGIGLLLAFTRRNPYMSRSPYVVTWSGR